MDAVKFIEERRRMCKSFAPDCKGCCVDEAKPVVDECFRWILDNPEMAVQIVEEWSAAHPRKTRQSEFLKQWPNADFCDDGYLSLAPCSIDTRMTKGGSCGSKCSDCRREFWTQEVE